jgi:hypothetical protein
MFAVGVARGPNEAAAPSLGFRGIIKEESSVFITVGYAGRIRGRCQLVHEGMGGEW